MILKDFDPLKGKMLQVLDQNGKLVEADLEPKISKTTLMKMYETIVLGRVTDTKAIQFQRQGRMLTYAPNHGQEAAQIGSIAAMNDEDWLVLAFRELNSMLYKGVTLKQSFLYWYGNEMGSHYDENVKVLPINVPIGSQINHAAGIAYASKLQDKKEAVIVYIGEGGTSHGEFHEGINFAALHDLPVIIVIQNNHYAISTPRAKATRAKTLAQKAIAYGIPGIQVDGNDPLAMYLATSEARKRAEKGEGPTLIEAVTYRMGPHTTSDNPKLYRSDEEVSVWEKKDPLIRFKKYMIDKGYLTEKKDESLYKDAKKQVMDTFKEVEQSGDEPLLDIFQYTYNELTPNLKEQMEDYQEYLEKAGE